MREIKISKKITELDELVFKFCKVIEKYTKYVIVSGYVSILLGEERPTQDVDILISSLSKDTARKMYEELFSRGFEIPGDFEDFWKILFELKEKIDIFTEKKWYFDVRCVKTFFDIFSLENRMIVNINGNRVFIAPPEIQIPYKIYLGADKDLKDAAFLYSKLKNIINMKKMETLAKEMGISLKVLENV